MELPIDSIIIGERVRKDLGDVQGLAESIADLGLLHPVVVTPEGRLVAGERRLAACRLLDWDNVPVRVIDNLDDAQRLLTAERDENTERKELLPSEAVSLGRRLEAVERPKAEERRIGNLAQNDAPEVETFHLGKTRDKVGAAVGVSGISTTERGQASDGRMLVSCRIDACFDSMGSARNRKTGFPMPPRKLTDNQQGQVLEWLCAGRDNGSVVADRKNAMSVSTSGIMGGMNAFDDIRFTPGTVWENPGILRVVVLQPKQKGKVRARVIEVLDPERAQYGLDELETWPVEKFALCFVRCLVMGFKREAQAAGN